MYNYVCAIDTYKKDIISPFAIKVGTTTNYKKRFAQLPNEALEQNRKVEDFIVKPLFVIEGDYDKYIAERIEDVLRLYYLRKLGFDRGYRKDWIAAEGLPTQYDVQTEIAEIKRLIHGVLFGLGAKVIFANEDANNKNNWVFGNFSTRFKVLYK